MTNLDQHPAYANWVAWGVERAQKHAQGRFEGALGDAGAEVAPGEVRGNARPSDEGKQK